MELKLNDNCCTDEIKIHPLHSATRYFGESSDVGVHILFDRRQIWHAYYYRFADSQGWVLQRDMIRVSMSEDDFNRIFGEFEIV